LGINRKEGTCHVFSYSHHQKEDQGNKDENGEGDRLVQITATVSSEKSMDLWHTKTGGGNKEKGKTDFKGSSVIITDWGGFFKKARGSGGEVRRSLSLPVKQEFGGGSIRKDRLRGKNIVRLCYKHAYARTK